MKTLITSDLHLSSNPRDEYRFHIFDWIHNELDDDESIRNVIILGDLTEAKDRHDALLVNRMVDELINLSKTVSNLYILKGNHDYVSYETPYYRFLQHFDKITWINEPTPAQIEGLGSCYFLPHTLVPEAEWEDLDFDDCKWVFCHQTFSGAVIRNQIMEGPSRRCLHAPSETNIISGDIHVPQKLGKNIRYVGAPYTIDFGDDYAGRVLIADQDTIESVDYTGPQKQLIEIESLDDLDAVEVYEGDILKVRVAAEAAKNTPRVELRNAIREWGVDAKVIVHTIQIMKSDTGTSPRDKRKLQQLRTDDELVEAYVKSRKESKEFLDIGKKIMEKI